MPGLDLPPRPEEEACDAARAAVDAEFERKLAEREAFDAAVASALGACQQRKAEAAAQAIIDDIVARPGGREFWWGLYPGSRFEVRQHWANLIRSTM